MTTHGAPPPRHREWKIGCKVYIGNLSEGASKADIEGAFSKFGPLRNVWVARNPPGFAFVEFEDGRDAEDACRHLDGTRIAGGRIKAEMSHGRTRRGRGPYAMGPSIRGGGHMGGYGGGPPIRGGGHMSGTRGGHYISQYAPPYPPPTHHHASRGGYHHQGYVGGHRGPAKDSFRHYSRSRSNSSGTPPPVRPRTPP